MTSVIRHAISVWFQKEEALIRQQGATLQRQQTYLRVSGTTNHFRWYDSWGVYSTFQKRRIFCFNNYLYLLQCDYYNQGHLDNVDQSDYRKITIHS